MKRVTIWMTVWMTALSIAAAVADQTNDWPAVTHAYTSKDPVVLQAWALVKAGEFKEAEIVLAQKPDNGNPEALRDREEAIETIHRIHYEYSLTPGQLLEKVRKEVPDATAKDVEHWAKSSKARFRMIDGEKFYFRYEPENIFLFSNEARHRRSKAGNDPDAPSFNLVHHLEEIVAEADRTHELEVDPVHHIVNYKLIIHTNALKMGATVRVWAPYPQEYRQQRNLKLDASLPEGESVAPSAIDGPIVTGGPQRTVYWEETVTNISAPMEFKLKYEFDCYAYYPQLDPAKVQPLPADRNEAYLKERLPHIAFTPEIRKRVAEIIGKETNALVKARKIFHWVSANIPWNAEDEYCTIPSFSIKGFTALRGDCGVQNTVFITMCRIAGIPARWQSGYETKPGKSWGMHDWSEIYLAPWGWIPTDASYGVKKSKDPRVADFYCGHQDSYRMIINLDWGRDLIPPKTSLRSDPSDFQRGEVEMDGKNLYYDQWDYKMDIDRTPLKK